MPENGMPGPVCDLSSVRESVCIHTRKIFDSCRDKDCVEDLRFYPTASAMELLSGCQPLVTVWPVKVTFGLVRVGQPAAKWHHNAIVSFPHSQQQQQESDTTRAC